MDREPPDSGDSRDDRIRILEFQVDSLRRELEALEARHAEAIYSAAWHFGWPVRVVERAVRRLFAKRGDGGPGGAASDGGPRGERRADPPQPLTRERIAARIAQRVARPV